jgi:hypothetical protein
MNRKYIDRYVTSTTFERSVFIRVNSLLPKGVTISDEINEFLKERLADLENEKKLSMPIKSPVKIFESSWSKNTVAVEQKQSLPFEIYGSKEELIKHVHAISDSPTAWKLKRNAKLVAELANCRAKSLQKEGK